MKKRIVALGLSLLLALGIQGGPAWAASSETLRVGLTAYQNTASVSLRNQELWLGYSQNGEFVSAARLSGYSGFIAEAVQSTYLAVDDDLWDFDEATRLAEQITGTGYTAYPAYAGTNRWLVYVETAGSAESVRSELDRQFDFSGLWVEQGQALLLKSGGQVQVLVAAGVSPQFQGVNDPALVIVGDRTYRGAIELSTAYGTGIRVINEVSMDDYLYACVPSEMPSSWAEEALKAQAVAARTYAENKRGNHSATGYDLCDTQHCQVYLGYTNEAASTTAAVNATAGEKMYYNGKVIEAVYTSSSGGHTASAKNVWTSDVPYLQGVAEINEVGARTWNKTFPSAQIAQLCADAGADIGDVTDIVVAELADGGRVQTLRIIGTRGTFTLNKDRCRTFFSLDSRMYQINGIGGGQSSEPLQQSSNLFVRGTDLMVLVESRSCAALGANAFIALEDADVAVLGANGQTKTYAGSVIGRGYISGTTGSTADGSGQFVFAGSGWGHGVGMSQYGAKGMADRGYTYTEILRHYYTGVTIE